MKFDIQDVILDKQALRERLARKPVGEKLRILEELRSRNLSIREGARTLRDGAKSSRDSQTLKAGNKR